MKVNNEMYNQYMILATNGMVYLGDICVGHTAWALEGRDGLSQEAQGASS